VTAIRQGSTWAEQAAHALNDAGYRRGGARRAILELLDEQACALSAVEIQQALSTRSREVSRASVYRVMEELEALGVLQRVEIGLGIVRYEPLRRGPGHHHHLVCDRCGRLEPFTDDGLERAIRRLSGQLPRRVSDHEIVIHGACDVCAAS
jgi:Fur family ferric uptake transcriptional regulator